MREKFLSRKIKQERRFRARKRNSVATTSKAGTKRPTFLNSLSCFSEQRLTDFEVETYVYETDRQFGAEKSKSMTAAPTWFRQWPNDVCQLKNV